MCASCHSPVESTLTPSQRHILYLLGLAATLSLCSVSPEVARLLRRRRHRRHSGAIALSRKHCSGKADSWAGPSVRRRRRWIKPGQPVYCLNWHRYHTGGRRHPTRLDRRLSTRLCRLLPESSRFAARSRSQRGATTAYTDGTDRARYPRWLPADHLAE